MTLCSSCKARYTGSWGNFDQLASQELPRSHRVTITLGSLSELISRRHECSFCGIITTAIATAWKKPVESLLAASPTTELILCNRLIGVVRKPESDTTYHENFHANEYRYGNCRLEIECKPAPTGCPSQVEIQAVDEGPGIKGLFDDAPLFTRRPSEKMHSIDFGLLKRWVSHCKDVHQASCRPDAVDETDAYLGYFRLIDVASKSLIDARPDDEFVALSYVWGKSPVLQLVSSTKDDLYRPGALEPHNKAVPKTIQDAIRVTERLNMPYLWVDALCIMQDDLDEKARVIGALDLIYGRAQLTIVAASGAHANAGLLGLEPGSRDIQSYELKAAFPESSHQFYVARETPTTSIQRSAWNSRGWTYQERLCSRRMLIFTDQQVVYRCEKSSWSEDTVLETDDPFVHYEEQPLFSLNLPNDQTTSFMRNVESSGTTNPLEEYARMVSEYSGRNLTYPGDILDAFTGGLKRFQRNCGLKGIDVDFLFGLPTTWFDLALCWTFDEAPEFSSRRWDRRLESCRHPSGVDVAFPSWSWMGWLGKKNAYMGASHAHRSEIEWYYVEPGHKAIRRIESSGAAHLGPPPSWYEPSDTVPREELGERWKPAGSPSTVTQSDLLDRFGDAADLSGKLVFYSSICFLTLLGAERKMMNAGPFWVNIKGGRVYLDPEWSKDREGQQFEFVVLSRSIANSRFLGNDSDDLQIMLIERREDGIAHRVGVGEIRESVWVDSGPTWQLVVLG